MWNKSIGVYFEYLVFTRIFTDIFCHSERSEESSTTGNKRLIFQCRRSFAPLRMTNELIFSFESTPASDPSTKNLFNGS